MSETEFVSKVLGAFSKIKGEIDEKGGEFDFRYTLVDYLFSGGSPPANCP